MRCYMSTFMCAGNTLQGECERNPQYMRGHDEWPGNCRMSCGACQVPAYMRDKQYNRKQVGPVGIASDMIRCSVTMASD